MEAGIAPTSTFYSNPVPPVCLDAAQTRPPDRKQLPQLQHLEMRRLERLWLSLPNSKAGSLLLFPTLSHLPTDAFSRLDRKLQLKRAFLVIFLTAFKNRIASKRALDSLHIFDDVSMCATTSFIGFSSRWSHPRLDLSESQIPQNYVLDIVRLTRSA